MFAIFDRIHSPMLPGGPPPSPLERSSVDDVVRADLARLHDSLPAGVAVSHVAERLMDGAAFGTVAGHPHVSWAERKSDEDGGRVFVVLYGKIDNEDEIRELYSLHAPPAPADPASPSAPFSSSSALLLTQLYWKGFSDAYGDYSSQPQTCLASLLGAWSFCLFDEGAHYVLAGRGGGGDAPMFWTSVQDADILFCTWRPSTDAAAAAAGLPCKQFPAGCFYEKKWNESEGSLHCFLEGAQGSAEMPLPMPCAAMFRVSSGSDLSGAKPGGMGM